MVAYRDVAPNMALGDAARLIAACGGMTEGEARTFLIEAIRDRSLRHRGPPLWVQNVDAIDWERSLVRPVVFGPDRAVVASTPKETVTVCRADVKVLCEGLRAPESERQAPGRKPGGPRSQKREISEAAERLAASDPSYLEWGGQRRLAEQLQQQFPDYQRDSIERIIRDTLDQKRKIRNE